MNAITQFPIVTPREIGGKIVDTLNARHLYAVMQATQAFTSWINNNIQRFHFAEDVDYIRVVNVGARLKSGPSPRDFFITIPMALILAKSKDSDGARVAYDSLRDYAENPYQPALPISQPVVNSNLSLEFGDIVIRQDGQGRYCLNDLHKAAGGEKKYQVSNFMRLDTTQELCAEIERSSDVSNETKSKAYVRVQGGDHRLQGTFVVKELVYAYAMWISPAFHLKVIRTFDSLVQQQLAAIQCQAVNHVIPADFVSRKEFEKLQLDNHSKVRRYEFMIDRLRDEVSSLLNRSQCYDVLLHESAITLEDAGQKLNIAASVLEAVLNRFGWIKREHSHVDSTKILKIGKEANRGEYLVLDTIIKNGMPTDIVKLTTHGFLYLSGLIRSRPELIAT